MSDKVTEYLHAIAGELTQVPLGRVPYVGLVPDYYIPPPDDFGTFGTAIGAGAAGTRSEISLALNITPPRRDIALLIENMEVNVGTAASTIEILIPSTISATTTFSPQSSDLGYGAGIFTIHTKNTAAAAGTTRLLVPSIVCATANVDVRIPGRWILRALANQNAIMIRATVDQVTVRLKGTYRALEQRKL